jgi:hypothetical protein
MSLQQRTSHHTDLSDGHGALLLLARQRYGRGVLRAVMVG